MLDRSLQERINGSSPLAKYHLNVSAVLRVPLIHIKPVFSLIGTFKGASKSNINCFATVVSLQLDKKNGIMTFLFCAYETSF